jgi:dihydroflavonol-4-reductase
VATLAAVPTTLLTGGAGLIGSQVARLLVERGDSVRLPVREQTRTENLDFEHEQVRCDILDRAAVRRAMKGVDTVFHTAGHTSFRASAARLFEVNAEGTRIVLEEALRANVRRVVHTSSVAAIGPAKHGGVADERQLFAGGYGIPYLDAKHEAEVQALRLAAKGLPVVIVNPAFVLGAGDFYRSSTEIVRRFLRREIPAYVNGAVNIVDVEDVARGHLLADEHGVVGERYILGNRNFTMDRLFGDLARLTGIEPPPMKLPLIAALAIARVAEGLPGPPLITTDEVRVGGLWWAYRSNKAKRELGYTPSHHEDTLVSTIEWYREDERRLSPLGAEHHTLPLRVGGFALRQTGSLLRGLGIG